MGVGGIVGHYLGKLTKVPVKDGMMNPYIYKYKDKIADLAHESQKVSEQYIEDLAHEALNRHDFAGMKVIYTYLSHQSYSTDNLIERVMWLGRELRLEQWMKAKFPNPFALIEEVAKYLC